MISLVDGYHRVVAAQFDALAAQVAMGYFVDGDDQAAYRLAAPAAKRSGDAASRFQVP